MFNLTTRQTTITPTTTTILQRETQIVTQDNLAIVRKIIQVVPIIMAVDKQFKLVPKADSITTTVMATRHMCLNDNTKLGKSLQKLKALFLPLIFLTITSCVNKSSDNNLTHKQTEQDNTVNDIEKDEYSSKRDCSDAYSAADDAYDSAKKAYNSDDWDDIKDYLKKAMDSFEDAMNYSEECKCDDAYSAADNGYTYAKRGYNSDDYEEMKDYARKAKNEADDAMSSANDCND